MRARATYDAAERALTDAPACSAAVTFRELAGVRAVQKRWAEASELAQAAVDADRSDAGGLAPAGTSLFLQDDRRGALARVERGGRTAAGYAANQRAATDAGAGRRARRSGEAGRSGDARQRRARAAAAGRGPLDLARHRRVRAAAERPRRTCARR